MVKNKEHLKENGLKEILLLKDKMGINPKNNNGDDQGFERKQVKKGRANLYLVLLRRNLKSAGKS